MNSPNSKKILEDNNQMYRIINTISGQYIDILSLNVQMIKKFYEIIIIFNKNLISSENMY